jgi:hypothetical protein
MSIEPPRCKAIRRKFAEILVFETMPVYHGSRQENDAGRRHGKHDVR